MSLVQRHEIRDAHNRNILAVAFNAGRRELFVAGEGIACFWRVQTEYTNHAVTDGNINVWDAENHKILNVLSEHTGWVTGLYYW
jgi:hypothetical protein